MLADGIFILLAIHESIALMAPNHDVEGFGEGSEASTIIYKRS